MPPALTPDVFDPDASFLAPVAAVDRAASLRDAVTAAASALGVASVAHVDIDAFVLVDADHGARFPRAVDLARQAVAAFYEGRFDKHPDRAVTVYVFSGQDAFQRFCRRRVQGPCPTTFGEYDRVTRTILMHATPGAETLTHEMVHPLVQVDFPRAPAWLDEGIAALYENPVFRAPGAITGIRNWRYDGLARALDAPDIRDRPTLDALFGMDSASFLTLDPEHPRAGPTDLARLDLHYATARYLAQWLDEQGKLWPFYRAWRGAIARDRTGETTFAAVVGGTPAERTPAWAAWVRALGRGDRGERGNGGGRPGG
jgi:hypothetical protein